MRIWRFLSFLAVISLLAVPMASAQETTGGMIGIVKDLQDTALSKVNVYISSPSLIGGTPKAVTGRTADSPSPT